MTNTELRQYLKSRGACYSAMDWLGDRDLATTWAECERADWLLWLIAPAVSRTDLVWLACQCARTALQYVPAGETRPVAAIETAERWTRGEASITEVRDAARAARAAEAVARAAEAEAAAEAAARAAEAEAEAEAAAWAAEAVARAAWAAEAAEEAARAAWAAAHKTMCAIIRAKYQTCPVLVVSQ